jgi:hypothetical protein
VVSKQEYTDWRDHPITQELYKDVGSQAEESGAIILRSSTVDTSRDQFHRGVINMASQVIAWVPELSEEL